MSVSKNQALLSLLVLHVPSIAQLVERWTVVGYKAEIHRSLVQIRFEGVEFLGTSIQ